MKSKHKHVRKSIELPCAELGPDDGVDPRRFSRRDGTREAGRKDLQLCRQVADALMFAISGNCDEELLRSVCVLRVEPAPDARRLLVVVTPQLSGDQVGPAAVLERLAARKGKLRCEVAAAIGRKRAPDLLFAFEPAKGALS
jgi:ribosome-binding factor A